MIYRNKKIRNYDPINDELLDDHHDNWVLEDSPPFLTVEELESLRKDHANMTIQPISDDIGMHVFSYKVKISLFHCMVIYQLLIFV